MHFPRRSLFALAITAVGFGVAMFALASPGPTACALIDIAPFSRLADGTLVEADAGNDRRAAALNLLSNARMRIQDTFGPPRAKPVVVFFDDPHAFGPLKLNEYGSTHFVGTKACVMVGPKGQNLDVVAHELMHAELFERVGFWSRLTQIPVWFDEGLAMQVDYRPRYVLSREASAQAKNVRTLESARDFFLQDGDLLTKNYAMAKAEVANWLDDAGRASVYDRLERIRAGESFNAVTQRR